MSHPCSRSLAVEPGVRLPRVGPVWGHGLALLWGSPARACRPGCRSRGAGSRCGGQRDARAHARRGQRRPAGSPPRPSAPARACARPRAGSRHRPRRPCATAPGIEQVVATTPWPGPYTTSRDSILLDHRGRLLADIDLHQLWADVGPCLALPRAALAGRSGWAGSSAGCAPSALELAGGLEPPTCWLQDNGQSSIACPPRGILAARVGCAAVQLVCSCQVRVVPGGMTTGMTGLIVPSVAGPGSERREEP